MRSHQNYDDRSAKAGTPQRDFRHQVQQIVDRLHKDGQYPSESRVAQLMNKPNFLRYEKVRSVLRAAKSWVKSQKTRPCLLEFERKG